MSTRKLSLENGHWLGYSDDGTGQPVVLLHSSGFSSRQWRRLREALSPTHRVLVPDLLGYGTSSPWSPGPPDQADDAPFHFRTDLAAIEKLLDTLDSPPHLVGHSYGGLLALHAALCRPVRSVAVYEPVVFGVLDPVADRDALDELARVSRTYTPDEHGVDERWLAGFVDWWNGPGEWAALAEPTRSEFRALGKKIFGEVSTLMADPTSILRFATISAPVLLLGGDRTPQAEQRVLDRLAAGLPGASHRRLAGLGHMGPITHAAQVNAAIAAHVRAAS